MRIKIGHLLFVFGSTQAFVVPSALHSRSLTTTNNNKNDAFFSSWSRLEAKKGKGFGEKNASPSPKKSQASPPPAAAAAAAAASTSTATATPQPREDPIAVANSNPFPAIVQPDLSMGKAALERLKREQVEKRDEELRKVKQIKDVDTMLRESPEAAVIPEKVAQRMGARMLPFVGIPLLGGMGAFVGFWYMSTYQGMSYEPSLVAASTIALLVFGLLVRLDFCGCCFCLLRRMQTFFVAAVTLYPLFSHVSFLTTNCFICVLNQNIGHYLFPHERVMGRRSRR